MADDAEKTTVRDLIREMENLHPDAEVICGEKSITLWVCRDLQNGRKNLDMMFIGTNGGPLIPVPVNKEIPFDLKKDDDKG